MATNEQRRDALVLAIRDSGLGIGDFAARYLARDQSTVYRWLSGDTPVPAVVERWLRDHATDIIKGDAS